jgi:DNA-directed RNA polymerase subunit L
LIYNKRALARNKEDKDYTKSEKQLLISLINDYSLFGSHDHEIIQMLSKKIGKNVSETLFYRLKKEAKQKRQDSEQWLDHYTKYQFIEFYRQRIEKLEYVQRNLLKVLALETEEEEEEEEEKQDKTLINQLSKTIAESSKVLSEFGLVPPVVSHMKNMISVDYFNSKNEEKKIEEEIRNIRNQTKNAKSASFFHEIIEKMNIKLSI